MAPIKATRYSRYHQITTMNGRRDLTFHVCVVALIKKSCMFHITILPQAPGLIRRELICAIIKYIARYGTPQHRMRVTHAICVRLSHPTVIRQMRAVDLCTLHGKINERRTYTHTEHTNYAHSFVLQASFALMVLQYARYSHKKLFSIVLIYISYGCRCRVCVCKTKKDTQTIHHRQHRASAYAPYMNAIRVVNALLRLEMVYFPLELLCIAVFNEEI